MPTGSDGLRQQVPPGGLERHLSTEEVHMGSRPGTPGSASTKEALAKLVNNRMQVGTYYASRVCNTTEYSPTRNSKFSVLTRWKNIIQVDVASLNLQRIGANKFQSYFCKKYFSKFSIGDFFFNNESPILNNKHEKVVRANVDSLARHTCSTISYHAHSLTLVVCL